MVNNHRIITILPKTTQKGMIFSLYEFIAFRFRVINFFPPAFFRCVNLKIDVSYKTCDQSEERSKPLHQSDVIVKPIVAHVIFPALLSSYNLARYKMSSDWLIAYRTISTGFQTLENQIFTYIPSAILECDDVRVRR